MERRAFRENVWLLRILAAAGVALIVGAIYRNQVGFAPFGIAALIAAGWLWRTRGPQRVRANSSGVDLTGDIAEMREDEPTPEQDRASRDRP